MKFLTTEYIRQHSRIDYNCEDEVLELYGSAAEEAVLSILRRTAENLKDMNGGNIPAKCYQAACLITDLSYVNRSPVSTGNKSVLPYSIDFLVKDLARLTDGTDLQAERDTLLDMLAQIDQEFSFRYDRGGNHSERSEEAYRKEKARISEITMAYKSIEDPTSAICAMLREEYAQVVAETDNIINNTFNND